MAKIFTHGMLRSLLNGSLTAFLGRVANEAMVDQAKAQMLQKIKELYDKDWVVTDQYTNEIIPTFDRVELYVVFSAGSLKYTIACKPLPAGNSTCSTMNYFADKASMLSFQKRVLSWFKACFGDNPKKLAAKDRVHRFIEEALELAQSVDMPKEDALMLVDYVYGRPKGEVAQECGGVILTLNVLMEGYRCNTEVAAEDELLRVWGKIDAVRAKDASKPAGSPLPGEYPDASKVAE